MKNKPQSEQTATPEKYPQGYFNPKACRHCYTEFTPKAPSHLYCSQGCVDAAHSEKYLKRTYGMLTEDYKRLYNAQSGCCAICGGDGFLMRKSHKMKLVVDHDHQTGVVRGLLCHNCNRALGLLHDDTDVLHSAIQYLKVQRLSREGVEPSGSKRTAPEKGDDIV